MSDAQHFEAIKYSLRQSKDGVVVAFVVQPHDVTPELMALPVGARVMIAWSQIGDDEKPVASVCARKDEALPSPPQAPEPKERRAFSSLPLAQQAAMRCGDAKFIEWVAGRYAVAWLHTLKVSGVDERHVRAAMVVRAVCGIASRSELGKSNHAADNCWRKLNSDFEAWELDQRYADVRR